jgi:hypothetical protein|tara:strand:- start:254 stop:442 length:189 start_codon:yes stop_codon:yes gene_type:complete
MKITPSIPRKPNHARVRRLQKDGKTVVEEVAEEDRIRVDRTVAKDAVGTGVKSHPELTSLTH